MATIKVKNQQYFETDFYIIDKNIIFLFKITIFLIVGCINLIFKGNKILKKLLK